MRAINNLSSTDSEDKLTKAIRWPIWPNITADVDADAGKNVSEHIEVDQPRRAGSYGSVQRGVLKSTREPVVIKTIRIEGKHLQKQFFLELEELARGRCPNLVRWYGPFFTERRGEVPIVMELMDRAGLDKLIKRCRESGVPSQHVSCIAAQITSGLTYLHSRNMWHKSIKPENILHTKQGEVKISDFCIPLPDLEVAPALPMGLCVTYISPERAIGEECFLKDDIWSFGIVVYELASGQHPFENALSFPALFEALVEKPEPRLDGGVYPAGLCDFVAQCLTRDTAISCGFATDQTSLPIISDPESALDASHLIVNNVGGGRVFGPAVLNSPFYISELLRLIFESGGIPHKKCQLFLGSRVLEDGEAISGGDADAPLVLTSVVPPARAEADELMRHSFLNLGFKALDQFAEWLATI